MKETEDIQNILTRLEKEVYLNVNNPSIRLKKQYHKAIVKLANTIHEFDILNDLKQEAPGK